MHIVPGNALGMGFAGLEEQGVRRTWAEIVKFYWVFSY